jgi:hypothetical protein
LTSADEGVEHEWNGTDSGWGEAAGNNNFRRGRIPHDDLFQGGFVVYPAGGKVAAHGHTLVERHLIGTAETVMVRRGKAILKLFDNAHQVVAERMMTAGDIVMLVSGGHGFTMLEDTILFEIKQGPYTGLEEKERFE